MDVAVADEDRVVAERCSTDGLEVLLDALPGEREDGDAVEVVEQVIVGDGQGLTVAGDRGREGIGSTKLGNTNVEHQGVGGDCGTELGDIHPIVDGDDTVAQGGKEDAVVVLTITVIVEGVAGGALGVGCHEPFAELGASEAVEGTRLALADAFGAGELGIVRIAADGDVILVECAVAVVVEPVADVGGRIGEPVADELPVGAGLLSVCTDTELAGVTGREDNGTVVDDAVAVLIDAVAGAVGQRDQLAVANTVAVDEALRTRLELAGSHVAGVELAVVWRRQVAAELVGVLVDVAVTVVVEPIADLVVVTGLATVGELAGEHMQVAIEIAVARRALVDALPKVAADGVGTRAGFAQAQVEVEVLVVDEGIAIVVGAVTDFGGLGHVVAAAGAATTIDIAPVVSEQQVVERLVGVG